MKNAVFVHVINGFDHLVHIIANSGFWEVVAAALDGLVHVHVHELENERKTASRFIVEHFN